MIFQVPNHPKTYKAPLSLGQWVLGGGEVFVTERIRSESDRDRQRRSLLAQLTARRLDTPGLLSPSLMMWGGDVIRSASLRETDHIADHPAVLALSTLLARTRRAIGSSPMWIMGPEVPVHLPFVHPEVLAIGLAVPFGRKVGGVFYRELLGAICGPEVAQLPSTSDPDQRRLAVVRRQTTRSALTAVAESIRREDQVLGLLDHNLVLALHDVERLVPIAHSATGRATLQWADTLATWLRTYRVSRTWPEIGSGGIA